MMQRKPWQHALLLCAIAISLAACDETSNIGGGLIPDRDRISADTLPVLSLPSVQVSPYTGDLAHFSAGRYEDPFFGPIEANAFILPTRLNSIDIDTLDEQSKAFLVVRPSTFYGDTLNATQYGIYRVLSPWRPSTFRASTSIETEAEPLATFEISNDSLLSVELPQTWIQEFKEYVYFSSGNADSNYVNNYRGLAIKGISSGKIISLLTDSTYIRFETENDTTTVGLRARAYNYNRERAEPIDNGVQISSNLENLASFAVTLDLAKLRTANISKALLVLEEDQVFRSSPLPNGHTRPPFIVVNAYDPSGLLNPDDIIILTPAIQFLYDDETGRFEANVTNLVRQMVVNGQTERTYYLSIQPRSGIFHNTMVDQSAARRPKLVLSLVSREEL